MKIDRSLSRRLGLGLLAVLLLGAMAFVGVRSGPLAGTRVTLHRRRKREPSSAALFGIGTVEARRSYLIGPTTAGRVLRVVVDVGDSVKAGQLLAEMDPVDIDERVAALDASMARAVSAAAAADAQRKDALAKRELAAMNARRYVDLGEKNFISPSAVEAKLQERTSADAGVSAAEANLAAALQDSKRLAAERAGLRQQRDNVRLLAPADAVVTSRDAEPGSTVVAGPGRDQADRPRFAVGQGALRPGPLRAAWQPACAPQIALRSNPAQPLAGTVARIEAVSDSVTEERLAQVAFERAPDGVSVGELAEVTVTLPATAAAVVVPNASLRQQGDQTGVWLAEGGALRFAPLRLGQSSLDGRVAGAGGPEAPATPWCCTAKRNSAAGSRIKVVDAIAGGQPMISLAGRDILHSWGKFVLTGVGLGLLIGVTLTMAGVYRGMVDDARVLLDNSGADLWVVQQDTQGPYAESSSIRDDAVRAILGLPGVARAANVTYLTMQVRHGEHRRARDGGGLRARAARRTGLPGRGPAHHAQPLRSGGRRADRLSRWATASASGATTTPWWA